MTSDYIIEVSESDFEQQVLVYSQKTPVVVDFWAEWCTPCRVLGPLLERLAQEAQGAFRLAKVNVDENNRLASQFEVRSIPAVKAFRDGRVIAEFLGAQPEPRVRDFIRALIPDPNDLQLEKANSLLLQGQTKAAEAIYRRVLQTPVPSPKATLGLAKSILAQGQSAEALRLIKAFPPSPEYSHAQLLIPLAEALTQTGALTLDDDASPLDATYYNALHLAGRGNIEAALDGLLDLLRQQKNYGNGQARQVFLALLELLGDTNPDTRQYRSELASVLF
jgi:putative thioredoxin